ncbi:MAG: 1-deoxy-D-xylulose-5-phosphate synthase, partial [Verrucomicrobia bacterium]|nr:1-deoxy-D-xylulose-5-phosphate synthase [Verrucomicrobiota bacterium]
PTHHGMFDISYLRCLPGAVVMQPKDEDEQVDMLYSALEYRVPTFIRWPRGAAQGTEIKKEPVFIEKGKAEVVREGTDVQFWALGPWVADCQRLADILSEKTDQSIGVVNARFAKPLDKQLLNYQAGKARLIVTFEDNVLSGGFGGGVLEAVNDQNLNLPVLRIGWPDLFVAHGSSVNELRAENGLDDGTILGQIEIKLEELLGNQVQNPFPSLH